MIRTEETAELPLHSVTPGEWGAAVLEHPLALLSDHAFLEKKAANNALELLTRWPDDFTPNWVRTMTSVARDETAHLAQVTRILLRRGGRFERVHKNPYANALRLLVRKGAGHDETVDRLLVSALIEARSCERFSVLALAAGGLRSGTGGVLSQPVRLGEGPFSGVSEAGFADWKTIAGGRTMAGDACDRGAHSGGTAARAKDPFRMALRSSMRTADRIGIKWA